MTTANNTLAPTDAEILALLPTVKLKDEDPKRMVWLTRKDALKFARAVLAKFGAPAPVEPPEFCYFCGVACAASDSVRRTPAPASQPVAATAGMGPVASKSHGAWDGIEDVLAMPDGTDIYTAAQVQVMLAAAPSGPARDPVDKSPNLQGQAVDKSPEMQGHGPAPLRCSCHTCWPIAAADPASMFMRLCPSCGNKRCPKANDHRHECAGSNEPGQPGSAYPAHSGITAAQKGGQHGAE